MGNNITLKSGVYRTITSEVDYDEHVYMHVHETPAQYRLTLDDECRQLNTERFYDDDCIIDRTDVGQVFVHTSHVFDHTGQGYMTSTPTNGDGFYYRYLSKAAYDCDDHVEPLSPTEFRLWHHDLNGDLTWTDLRLEYYDDPQLNSL